MRRVKSFQKRSTIFSPGETAHGVPKLLEGAVMIYEITEDGQRQILDLAGPGDFLHFDPSETLETYAEALMPCEVIYLDADELQATPEASQVLIKQMRDRLTIERRHISMLTRRSAADRLSEFIKIVCLCLGTKDGRLTMPLTRQQIADSTGLTIETVSRVFSKWQKESVITQIDRQTYQLHH